MNTNTQNIVMNLDFALRAHKPKSILVTSDMEKEGKSSFIKECIPLLCDLYERKVLIFDCQSERKDILENSFSSGQVNNQFIHRTQTKGMDYIHVDDLFFLQTLPQPEKVSSLVAFFDEVSKNYDSVFINTKTFKKSEKPNLPGLPIDGAIIVRSKKSLNKKVRNITRELEERSIPILGLVMNGGAK